MTTYTLLLKNDKQKFYKSFSILILIINTLAICLFLYYRPQTSMQRVVGIFCLLLAVSVIVAKEKFPTFKYTDRALSLILILIALYWLWLGYGGAALVILILSLLYGVVNRTPQVKVSDDHILYPSFPTRRIEWKELNNLVVKDGLLTIDFKNNRIIQQMLEPVPGIAEELKMNDFCKIRLNRS